MKVALVGTGLIGGSIGLALKERMPDAVVTAFDRDAEVSAAAVERGAADRAAPTVEEAAAGADLVFIATPVGAVVEATLRAAEAASSGAILTDVGSVKSHLVVEVEKSLPSSVNFIGGHPMAGSEMDGIEAAEATLFAGAWWILTPTARSDERAYSRLHALLTTLGARVMALDPAEHDRLLALISHLPQLVATTLMERAAAQGAEDPSVLALAAGGFRDVTRIAASNPRIWVDICAANSRAIAAELRGFGNALLQVADEVEGGDLPALRARLEAGREGRRALPGKDIEAAPFVVRIPIPDKPGVLAEVTTTVGNAGVNIEDLEIAHAAEGGRGTLVLTVGGGDAAEKVRALLQSRGYDPRVIER